MSAVTEDLKLQVYERLSHNENNSTQDPFVVEFFSDFQDAISDDTPATDKTEATDRSVMSITMTGQISKMLTALASQTGETFSASNVTMLNSGASQSTDADAPLITRMKVVNADSSIISIRKFSEQYAATEGGKKVIYYKPYIGLNPDDFTLKFEVDATTELVNPQPAT